MGTFFSNCQVQSSSQEATVTALTKLLKEPAYVSPSVGGWVGVYPEGHRTGLDKIAKQLSKQLSCGVFTWNVHDDDIFWYSLYENGKMQDEFNSSPDYFNPVTKPKAARLRGKPEALVPFCLPGIGYAQVQEVLHPPSRAESGLASAPPPHDTKAITKWLAEQQKIRDYQTASGQAGGLAALLGIDWHLSSLDYGHNERGNLDSYIDKGFVFIDSAQLSAKNLQKKLWELPMQFADIKAAIEAGTNVNERDQYGDPFLLMAASNCAVDVVQLLLDSGADVNIATTIRKDHGWEERGVTALMAACGWGADNTERQIETVQLLITAGANVNAKSEAGRAALEQVQQSLKSDSNTKPDRWHSAEELAEGVARNTKLLEILRAAGATE